MDEFRLKGADEIFWSRYLNDSFAYVEDQLNRSGTDAHPSARSIHQAELEGMSLRMI